MRIVDLGRIFVDNLKLDFVHLSSLGAWAICYAARQFYLDGFKNPSCVKFSLLQIKYPEARNADKWTKSS